MKTCSNVNCSIVGSQNTDCFYKNRSTKDGLSSRCKLCHNKEMGKYKKTPEGKAACARGAKKWAQTPEGKKSAKIASKKYNQSPKGKAKDIKSQKKYSKTPKGKDNSSRTLKKYRSTVKGKLTLKKYNQSPKGKENRKRYSSTPKAKFKKTHREASRRANKANATPKCLSDEHKKQILKIYEFAKLVEKTFGIKTHVDHIVPLKGKNVSGLHVPWNLQVLSACENLSKGNKIL